MRAYNSFADPGIFAGGGGGGGSRPDCQKTVLTCFFSPQLILQFLQRVSNGYFKENYSFPWFQRGGGQHLPRGPIFSRGGGSKC